MSSFLLSCLMLLPDTVAQEQFEAVYLAHRHTMFYVAKGVLHDDALAEDAVQEAFLRVLKNFHKIDAANCHKTRGFLVVIVKNVALTMLAQRQKRGEVWLMDETHDPAAGQMDVGEGAEHIVSLLRALPETYAHVMLLRYVHEMTEADCAALLEIKPATVRKRLERGRALLQQRLDEEAKSI